MVIRARDHSQYLHGRHSYDLYTSPIRTVSLHSRRFLSNCRWYCCGIHTFRQLFLIACRAAMIALVAQEYSKFSFESILDPRDFRKDKRKASSGKAIFITNAGNGDRAFACDAGQTDVGRKKSGRHSSASLLRYILDRHYSMERGWWEVWK